MIQSIPSDGGAPACRSFWAEIATAVLLLAIVSVMYGVRLSRLPIVGEESRWATSAREMLATGDWIVPRQQGQIFSERPPMTVWLMAVVGHFRGDVDAIAIRLPSALAVVLTSLVAYLYTRLIISRRGAIAAALAYATFFQVLQIGRMGESEAVFTLFVSASLLLWHLGYTRRWPPLATWSLGFALAALAALTKGPQAPVYFVAITGVYLVVRRDWRYLLCWQYAAGAAIFATIIAAWQVPFYWATDLQTTVATWAGLATDRVHLGGLAKHIALYPLETVACLLPWSPLLVALIKRETRSLIADQTPLVTFLVVAFTVSYPTVWFVAGAEPRYFMPLYPFVAVLVGLVFDRCCVAEPGHYPRRAWHQFLFLNSAWITACGLALGLSGLIGLDWITQLNQPRLFCIAFGVLAATAAIAIAICYRRPQQLKPITAVVAIATLAAAAYTGIVINRETARWHDPTLIIAEFKSHVPNPASLVSLSPINHRFTYYYDAQIAELAWPERVDDVPAEVEYFCFMRRPGDTAESRAAGRGRSWGTTPGTLPFAWQEITSICVERRLRDEPQRTVVLGRVFRPIQAAVSDVTVPQVASHSRRKRGAVE